MATTNELVVHAAPELHAMLEQAKIGKLSAMKRYLAAGGQPNVSTKLGDLKGEMPLLHAVVWHLHDDAPESIALLIKAGANVAATSKDPQCSDRTALMWAAQKASFNVVKALLEGGADPYQHAASDATTALHVALCVKSPQHLDKVKLLLTATARRDPDVKNVDGSSPLMCAAQQGFTAAVIKMHQLGADINATNTAGYSSAHLAAENGHLPVLKYLLEHGADANARTPQGATVLLRGILSGSIEVVQLLIKHGADIRAVNCDGMNVLFPAAAAGHVRLMQQLSNQFSFLKLTDASPAGVTLLMQAVCYGQMAAAEYLIAKGLSCDAVDNAECGQSVLQWAMLNADRPEFITLLLKHGANIHRRSDFGVDALLQAVMNNRVRCVEVLLKAGADVGWVHPVNKKTILHLAVVNDHHDVVKLLLQHGGGVNRNALCDMCECCGQIPPIMLCRDPTMLRLLLEANADVRKLSRDGHTCLHVAAKHGHPAPVLCMLIKAGANLHALNRGRKTAAEVAELNDHKLAAALLARAAERAAKS